MKRIKKNRADKRENRFNFQSIQSIASDRFSFTRIRHPYPLRIVHVSFSWNKSNIIFGGES